jgi:ribosome-binding protein aMBF1 (putative translation factor)
MTKKPTKKAKAAPKRTYGKNKNPFIATKDSLITQEICSNVRTLFAKGKKAKGWTQKEFGEHIGVPEPYIKGVLQKRYAPSHACIAQIAKLFDVSVDWIYGLSKV